MGIEQWLDNWFGFLPNINVILTTLGTSVLIVLSHYIYRVIYSVSEVPWMKPANERARKKLPPSGTQKIQASAQKEER